ncbi:MAG: sugar-binding transcriptional regulator [Anaerolineae bacterium]|nr:sugar-binding transcriptional regulator [Anaerolineae bacterium]NUQ05355.1 sugar-binding transcriptional regulator [Anaerolineae bacterium]
MLDPETHELLARVASMYYEQDMTQNEIADELGISRVKVYRLLRDSRSRGVVQISIDWPIKRDAALEQALAEAFGLDEALVLRTALDQPLPMLRQLGYLGARYLESLLKDISSLAICLGRSTFEVINAIRPDLQAHIRIVQAIGSMPYPREEYDSSMLARQLAQKLGGQVVYLNSPLMADTAHAAQVIRSQRNIQHALTMASSADIALLGIGNLDPQTSGFIREGFLTEDELAAFAVDGAVGDLAWRIFTQQGAIFPCDFNERVIGISLEDLRRIPTTVAVAAGSAKVPAMVGALRLGVINVLCTDDKTAGALLHFIQR